MGKWRLRKKRQKRQAKKQALREQLLRDLAPDQQTRATAPAVDHNKNRGVRELAGSIRKLEGDGNERKFVLSFSSEEPYTRWFGQEILDHSDGCVDLSRLNEIGVVLYNHNRDAVIGKVTRAWVEDNRGNAEIEFDSDEESEKIYQKVKTKTLKGVSVGYLVEDWEEVLPNKQSQDGRFTGPCSIAKKWAPYEISIVSVPADPTVGVGRELGASADEPESLEIAERQLQINKNLMEVNSI